MVFDIRHRKLKRKQIYHYIIVQSNVHRQAPQFIFTCEIKINSKDENLPDNFMHCI